MSNPCACRGVFEWAIGSSVIHARASPCVLDLLHVPSAANIVQLDKDAEGVEERMLHEIVLANRKEQSETYGLKARAEPKG